MYKLRRFLLPYKKQLFLGPLFKLMEAILELITPLLMASLIDRGVKNNDIDYIVEMSIYISIFAFIGLGCALFCQYSASVASQGSGTALRNALFKKINTFSHKEINKFGVTTLVNRLTTDTNQIQLAVAMFIRLVLRAPFLCIGGIIMAMTVDFKLSLVLLIFILIFTLAIYIIMRKTIPLYKTVQIKLDRLSVILRENLTGVRVVRAFANSDGEIKRFENANAEWMDISITAGRMAALLSPVTLFIMNAAVVCIILFGGVRVEQGGLTQGELIAFLNYITQIMLALIVVSNLTIIFTRASAAASRVNEIFDTEPQIDSDNENSCRMSDLSSVEFKNVSFGYHNNKYALKNISFKAGEGDTVGIIGGTGSGKSTLINLIPRFYDVSDGEILINGINLKEYNLESLRNIIGIVPQKVSLFSGSIRSNLLMGKRDANQQDMRLASKTAQADEFIENLPYTYENLLSQGGRNLSGGQRQRLTIARALIRKPKILLLDDSSSALDYSTDAKLRKAIKENNYGITFIVSQRVSSVMHADFIIVLEDGEADSVGSHEELLFKSKLYQEICESQNTGGKIL